MLPFRLARKRAQGRARSLTRTFYSLPVSWLEQEVRIDGNQIEINLYRHELNRYSIAATFDQTFA